jgi:hypothetical protein
MFALDDARRQANAYAAAGVTQIVLSVGPTDRAWVRSFAEETVPSYRA